MKTPLRIIQVVNVRWFNATAWYGLTLSRLLLDAGHQVLTLVLPGTDTSAKAKAMGLEKLGLPLNSGNPLMLARLTGRLASLLRDFKPHVVNCHRGEAVLLWGLLKGAAAPFALVRTRGDQRPPRGNLPNRYLHCKLVDEVIATNSRTLGQCRDLLGLEPERLHLVLGGADKRRFFPDAVKRADARRALGYSDEDLVFGLLGRFDPVKGQRELMQALRQALDRLPEKSASGSGATRRARLLLVGFDASFSEETLRNWAGEYGLADRLAVTGRVDDVPAHINALDIGVVASQGSEAIARAAFEIMACGVPLLGTDVGVMPDLLQADALARPGDAEALAALLARAMTDEGWRESVRAGQAERMRGLGHDDFLRQSLEVYASAMRRAGVVV